MSSPAASRQLATFMVDGLLFGIDVLKVQEVMRYQPMTSVPLAPTVVQGLINLRGQIVTAVDLRRRLGLASRPAGARPMNVVVRTPDGTASLQVDEIGDVLELDAALYEPAPDTLRGKVRELISGVYKTPKRLLHVLDPDKAADFPLEED